MQTPTPYLASLRIYQPAEVFDAEAVDKWRSLIRTRGNSITAEQQLALTRVIRPAVLHEDGAHLIEINGQMYVCPWTTDERSRRALIAFRESLPASVVRMFLAHDPRVQDERVKASVPIPHIQTETWVVPPRWLTLFEPSERILIESGSGPSVRYLTTMGQARKRAARHLRTIRSAFGESAVTAENQAQAQWLEEFHPHSMVELDYGGLARYLAQVLADEGGIEADSSVEDVLDSLDGLERGDGLAAGVGYQRLMGRWRRVAIFEHAS